jgi:hypothetical protein
MHGSIAAVAVDFPLRSTSLAARWIEQKRARNDCLLHRDRLEA